MKKDMVSQFVNVAPQVSSPLAAPAPPPVTAEAIPAPPADWMPLSPAQKNQLRKAPDDQRAELQQGLEQVTAKAGTVKKDLGELAPEPGQAIKLRLEMDRTRAVRVKAETLLAYAQDEEERANHAAVVFIDDMAAEVEHVARKRPVMVVEYDKVLKVSEQRSQAIIAGQIHARELKAAAKKSA